MKPLGSNTQRFWEAIQPVFNRIINCQYIKRLSDGTLPQRWFSHYISQDALYIIDDSRALAAVAARATDPGETFFFIELAKDGLDIERDLETFFMKTFKIPPAIEKSPKFRAYADFLLENAFKSAYPVALAALLPCFWVYNRTGEYVFQNSIKNNPYKKWIDTYSGGKYRNYTQKFIQIVEMTAEKSDSKTRNKMEKAFFISSEFEMRVLEEAQGI